MPDALTWCTSILPSVSRWKTRRSCSNKDHFSLLMKLFSPFALPFVAGCIWASCVTASGAGAIPAGSYLIKVSDGSRSILVYTYKPKSGTDGPLLLVFHGLTRNASDYRDY